MDPDSSQIFNQRSPPGAQHNAVSQSSIFSFSYKVASVIVLVVFGYATISRAWNSFLKWQERSYRLATRRKHGIPDTDHRPFNVAHAAVLRARQEREVQERSRHVSQTAREIIEDPQGSGLLHPEKGGFSESRNIMPGWLDRSPSRPASSQQPAFPATTLPFNDGAPTSSSNFVDRYHHSSPVARLSDSLHFPKSYRVSNGKHLDRLAVADRDIKENSSDDDDEYEPVKKVHVDGFPVKYRESDLPEPVEKSTGRVRRGAKRLYGDDDDDVAESKRTRGKRARKVSKEHRPEVPEQMMIDEDGDEVTALRSISRGKKRDRTEAGSTFGGDDEDSMTGTDSDDGAKVRQRRKRRTVVKRKSEVYTRGKKRDRDADWQDVDDEEDSDWPKNRKKREKRLSEDEGYQGSDTSMDDSQISQDPLCNGRRIGEGWEVSGIRYKVGPSGKRLRQALVKKARSKFLMPKDSQHPDREANLEVFVETWLTEDQYNEAKDRQQLAWQDSPKVSMESEVSDDVPTTPSKDGKDLLWSVSRRDSPSKAKPFRQSIATTVGLRINSLQHPLTGSNRRVTSAFIGDLGSPKLARTFSKWEKQDLEAEAMARLRERKRAAEPVKPGVNTSPTSSQTPSAIPSPVIKTNEGQTVATDTKHSPAIFFGVSPAVVNAPLASEPSKATATPAPMSFNITPVSAATPSAKTTIAQAQQSQPKYAPALPTFQLSTPSGQPAFAQAKTDPSPSHLSVPGFNKPKTSTTHAADTSRAHAPTTTQTQTQSNMMQNSVFNFTTQSTSNNTSTDTRPQISFGYPRASVPVSAPGNSQANAQKKPEPPAGDAKGSASLMDRIGGFANPPNSTASGTAATSGSTFSFTNSTMTSAPFSSKPTSTFTSGTTPTQATSTKATTPASGTGGSSTAKFDFGIKNKTSNTSAPMAAPLQSASNVAPNPVSTFGTPQAFAPSKPAEPTKSTAKFSFGMTSGTGFDNVSGNKTTTPDQTGQPSTTKSAFSGFGGSQAAITSVPPLPSTSSVTSGDVFGSTAWGKVDVPPSRPSPFQTGSIPTAKPAETKSTISFATPSTGPSTGEAPKTGFSFTNAGTANTPEEQKKEFKFNFSAAPASSQPSIFGAQTEKKDLGGSVFGKPGLTTFAFGASSKDSEQVSFTKPASTTTTFTAQPVNNTDQTPAPIFGAQSTGQFAFGVPTSTNASTDKPSVGNPTQSSAFTFGPFGAAPPSSMGQQQQQ